MAGDALEICDLTAEDSSPVNELSFRLQNLQCQDGLSPKRSTPRKLVLTPECMSSSLNTLSREKETPTVRRRRASRSLSPESTSNTPRCPLRNNQDFPANKENERAIKRLRVRLSSRFSSSNATETAGRNRRQYRSDPEEDATPSRETEAVDPMAAVRFRQLMSQLQAPPTPVTQVAVADLTLIGDFSKQHLLPVESAGHQEHHCISAQTVASLIRGQFGSAVEDFLIVDCRYPYEYQGGHIKGAVNLYTEHQVQQVLHQASAQVSVSTSRLCGRSASDSLPEDEESPSRKLIIFHCEFSSERGPHLCQYLRRLDRCVNVYPSLHYPELYLLLGGYKHFHASYPDLCDPCGYVSMRQREYREQLNSFLRRRQTRQRRRRPIRRHHRTKR
ncbi:cell division cycle 25 homolog d isoform X1 [Danio rerio]|uniref:protein-tyrosine-phosphatase n=2 Tax=Danio rerio TaxID=7955 RepID=A0A8M6Z595_DANRE|nr:cell division cycle 25 homolog d isoform X1 [Danio rerio]|eukprot:XP_017210413.1 cell division cycle 25 homolog d isoform X1 [Danio rerio]